ncbi:MAG TPA: c-type cytochrome [Vicinamibacterales bacterium]
MMTAAALLVAGLLSAQEPPVPPAQAGPPAQGRGSQGGRGGRGRGGEATREFLGLGREPDPAVAARGEKVFAAVCAFCHGPDARGAQGPSLVRSDLVLHDDHGELIGAVVLKGRPEKGMPAMPDTPPAQIAEIAEYLHLLVERAANRGLYGTLYSNDVLTGDPKAGEAYFEGAGGCRTCHSPTGDLAHVASKYSGAALQNRWLWPAGGRGDAGATRATVTLPSGEHVTGRIKHLDDFDVSIVDGAGGYHSWPRSRVTVELADPLKAHRELLGRYNDADVHNVTAYLATLK